MPLSTLSLTANYRISDSGGNYSGYDGASMMPASGYSGGYFGGAYTGGAFGFGSSYGGKTVSRTLAAHYTPLQFLSLDSSLTYSYTAGDNATNTSSTGRDFGIMANPWSWLQLSAHLSFQNMDYIGSFGGMKSRVGFYRMMVGPLAGFTLDLNYQDVTSESMISSIFDPFSNGQQAVTSLKGWTAELSRAIGSGRRAFLQYQTSNASGILANSKSVSAIGVEFPLTKIMGLTLDWRVTKYSDRVDPLNSYSANSLNAQLGARFW